MNAKLTKLAAIALGVSLSLGVTSAMAATATATFNVTATVNKNCITSASDLAFPSYTPGGGNVDGSTTVLVRCTKNTPYTIDLNVGSAANGGTYAARQMKESGGVALQYQLYTDTGRTTVWGDTTAGTSRNSGTGTGISASQNATFTAYGRIFDSTTNQDTAVPANYTDTITVTVTY